MTRRFQRGVPPYPEEQNSSRGDPQARGEAVGLPGIPGSLVYPSGDLFAPAEKQALEALRANPAFAGLAPMIPALQVLIAGSIQRAFDKFSLYTQVKPFTNFEVVPVALGAGVASAIDPPNQQMNRRALFLVNTDTANAIWFNKTEGVAVNNGIPIAPNFGSHMAAISEYVRHFAFCAGAATLIAVWYA